MKLKYIHIVAVVLLLIGFALLHNFYHTFLRYAIMGISGYSAILVSDIDKKWLVTFILIAILYNPFMPIPLDDIAWFIFNILSIIVFIIASFLLKLDEL